MAQKKRVQIGRYSGPATVVFGPQRVPITVELVAHQEMIRAGDQWLGGLTEWRGRITGGELNTWDLMGVDDVQLEVNGVAGDVIIDSRGIQGSGPIPFAATPVG